MVLENWALQQLAGVDASRQQKVHQHVMTAATLWPIRESDKRHNASIVTKLAVAIPELAKL